MSYAFLAWVQLMRQEFLSRSLPNVTEIGNTWTTIRKWVAVKNENWNEEHRIFQDAIRDFAQKEIVPVVDEAEETNVFPKQLSKKWVPLASCALGTL